MLVQGGAMFPRLVTVLLAVLFCLSAVDTFVPSLSAAPLHASCDAVVEDDAGVFGTKLRDVQNSASSLGNQAKAEVRVRTIKSFDQRTVPNLSAYTMDIVKQCPSWRNSDGTMKNNLVVMIIAIDNQRTFLGNGKQWDSRLTKEAISSIEKQIEPKFMGGNFADGITEGLRAVQNVLTRPASASTGGGSLVQNTTVNQASDLSGFWWTLVVVVTICGMTFFIVVIIPKMARGREEKIQARESAEGISTHATSRCLELNSVVETLGARLFMLKETVAKTALFPLEQQWRSAKSQVDSALESNQNLIERLNNPDQTTGSYRSITSDYQTLVMAKLDKAENIINEISDQAGRLTENPRATVQTATSAPPPTPISTTKPFVKPSPIVQPTTVLDFNRSSSGLSDAANDAIEEADSVISRTEAYTRTNWYYVDPDNKRLLERAKDKRDEAIQARVPMETPDRRSIWLIGLTKMPVKTSGWKRTTGTYQVTFPFGLPGTSPVWWWRFKTDPTTTTPLLTIQLM